MCIQIAAEIQVSFYRTETCECAYECVQICRYFFVRNKPGRVRTNISRDTGLFLQHKHTGKCAFECV